MSRQRKSKPRSRRPSRDSQARDSQTPGSPTSGSPTLGSPFQPARAPLSLWLTLAATVGGYLLLYCRVTIGGGEGISRGMLLLLIPFGPDELLQNWIGGDATRIGVLDRLPVLGLVIVWLLLAYVSGAVLFWLLRLCVGKESWLEHVAFATPIGLHFLSLLVFGLGWGGGLFGAWLLSRWTLSGLLLAVVGVATLYRKRVFPQRAGPPTPPDQDDKVAPATGGAVTGGAAESDDAAPWLLLLLAPFAVLLLACSLLPAWEFDVREYHLQAPKEWFQQGGVGFMPHNVYANMPLGAEMHALGGMVLVGDWWRGALVGKGVIGAMNLLTALLLFCAVRRRFGSFAGAVSAVLYISWPFAFHIASAGLIDAALAMYVVLAFLAFERWREELSAESKSANPWLCFAALAAGAAMSCKYPGVLLTAIPLTLGITVVAFRKLDARQAWRNAAVFVAVALATASPWYVKNLALTGNPVYPLLGDVLGGATRTDAKIQQWEKAHATPADSEGRKFTLRQAFAGAARVLWRYPFQHPLLVPLALLGFATAATRRASASAWAAIGAMFLLWFLATHRIDRFWLPLGPLLCYAAGIGAGASRHRDWRGALSLIVATASIVMLAYCASRHLTPENRILVAYEQLQRDTPRPTDPYQWTLTPSHDFLNQSTGTGEAVLLVGDAQPFDLEPHTFYNTCFDDCLFEVWMADGAAGMSNELSARDIRYVLVDWSEIERYRATYGFTDFVQPEVLEQLVADQVLEPISYPGEDQTPSVQLFLVREQRK